MSGESAGWVWRYSPLTGTAFAVHLAIADSANDQYNYEFWMYQRNLANKARCSRASAQRALDNMLEDVAKHGAGSGLRTDGTPALLIVLARSKGDRVQYRMLMPDGYTPRYTAGVPHGEAGGVPHGATGGASPRGRGVPQDDAGVASPRGHNNVSETQEVTQPSTQQLFDGPAAPVAGAAKGKKAKPLEGNALVADEVARAEWERRKIKPVCGFVAFRLRIGEALEAGYSREQVAAALPSMSVFSRNSFDMALGQRAGASGGRRPVDDDRAGHSGRINL